MIRVQGQLYTVFMYGACQSTWLNSDRSAFRKISVLLFCHMVKADEDQQTVLYNIIIVMINNSDDGYLCNVVMMIMIKLI